ncbi:MAG: glycogen synthase [Anaerolineae bacterium]|nr:glycogen synthase [Anaerolineae bacterium]
MKDELKVLFLVAEAAPFAKVGGLADVAAALPRALRALGIDARLMLPRYGSIQGKDFDFRHVGHSIPVPLGSEEERVHLLETTTPGGVPAYLIWDKQYFYAREKIYGFRDDPQRFAFFSRAVISVLKALDWKPDVIHTNDWHTAPVTAWLNVYGRRADWYSDIATLFTIHNLAYQGICGRLILTFAQMEDVPHLSVEKPGQVNWMAQGIAHADLISTVSPSYAREILTEGAGSGLESLLQERRDRLFGILSGIDTEFWNPAIDTALTQTFDSDSLKMRVVNKSALQRELRLPTTPGIPLLGFVARLDILKGLEVLIPALETLLDNNEVQFLALGTGEAEYEERLRALQTHFPDNVRVLIRFDERMARRIYGSVDMIVIPSRSEPISMGQMVAMRYGAVPIVRATGGLTDTIVDVDMQPSRGTGFIFYDYTTEELLVAIKRGIEEYADKARWHSIQQRAMNLDLSWGASARAYVDLYRRAQALHRIV